LLDGRLRAALELPLSRFVTQPAAASASGTAPRRSFALAASVVLALVLAGGAWIFRPQDALADEVLAHVEHEASAWEQRETVATEAVADVLRRAGVEFDTSVPVTYASSCPFRGRRVPHLVVQTGDGPVTVLLLSGEKVPRRRAFSEDGYRGVLLPAGEGSIAVLARGAGAPPDALAAQMVNAVRWR
jgi:hypothetical protein